MSLNGLIPRTEAFPVTGWYGEASSLSTRIPSIKPALTRILFWIPYRCRKSGLADGSTRDLGKRVGRRFSEGAAVCVLDRVKCDGEIRGRALPKSRTREMYGRR